MNPACSVCILEEKHVSWPSALESLDKLHCLTELCSLFAHCFISKTRFPVTPPFNPLSVTLLSFLSVVNPFLFPSFPPPAPLLPPGQMTATPRSPRCSGRGTVFVAVHFFFSPICLLIHLVTSHLHLWSVPGLASPPPALFLISGVGEVAVVHVSTTHKFVDLLAFFPPV